MSTASSSASKPSGQWQPPTLEEMQAMLPQYQFVSLLGRGGMGAVYKAVQISLDRPVAIKVLPVDLVDDDESQFAERFKNEARTMAKMNHPSIVDVFNFGETQTGLLYIVMEFIDGTDVSKMISSQGKLPEDYALSITAHVCDALAYAHKSGIIHRDIKPANILINQEGTVKVADFGLAKASDAGQSGITKTNMAMGTPDFVAPEAFIPGIPLDGRADLYAIGVMLYQMLTGEIPRGLWTLPGMKLGTDPRFDAIITKAMQTDREVRYQTAAEIRQELDVILTTPRAVLIQQQQAAAEAAARATQAQKQAASGPQKPMASGPQKRMPQPVQHSYTPPPRSKTPLLLGLTAAAAMAVGAFVLLGGKKEAEGGSEEPTSVAGDAPALVTPAAEQSPMTSSSPAGESVPTVPVSAPPPVDLLATVDLARDVVSGEWLRVPEGIAVKATSLIGEGTSRLQFSQEPPEEYDMKADFTPSAGDQAISLHLWIAGRPAKFSLNRNVQGTSWAGFGRIAGKAVETNNGASVQHAPVPNGERQQIRVEVRRGELRGYHNGALLVRWSGDFGTLGVLLPDSLHDEKRLGIASLMRAVTFHRVTVRAATGDGPEPKVVATPVTTVASLPTTGWQPLTLEASGDSPSADGWGKLTKATFAPGNPPDIAIRARLRFVPNSAGISAQSTNPVGSYRAEITPKGDAVMLQRDSPVAAERKLLARAALSAPLTPGQEYVLAVASVGDTVSVHVDGRPLLSERLPKLPGSVVLWTRSPVEVRDIQWLSLSPAAAPAIASAKPVTIVTPAPMPSTPADKTATAPATKVGGDFRRRSASLIPLVDVKRDVVSDPTTGTNVWKSKSSVLTFTDAEKAGRIAAPVSLKEAHDYEIDLLWKRRKMDIPGSTTSDAGYIALDVPLGVGRWVRVEVAKAGDKVNAGGQRIGFTGPSTQNGDGMRVVVRCQDDKLSVKINGNDIGSVSALAGRAAADLGAHSIFKSELLPAVYCARGDHEIVEWTVRALVGEIEVLLDPSLSADPYLAKLESGFQARYQADAQKPFEVAVAALNQSYVANGIVRARAAAKAKGSLTEVTALDAEKAAIEKGEGVPAEDAAGMPEALKTLRGTYRSALAKITAERDAKAAPLLALYLKALDAHVAELTKTGKIDEAKQVQAFRDEKAAKKSPAAPVQTQAAAPSTPVVSGDASYAAAKFLVSNGGSCVAMKDGVRVEVKTPDTIPAAPFEIHELYFDTYQGASKTVTSADFQALKGLHQLRRVNVRTPENKRLTDDAYAFLAGNEDLDFLNLEGVPAVTDAVLKHLTGAKKLRELGVQYAPGFTGEGLAAMPFLANLSRVDFLASGLDDKGIEALAACVQISSIRITQGKASDKAFAMLGQLPKLVDLRVDRTSFGDKAAAAIASAGILQYLDVSSTQIGNNGLGKLEALTSLTSLVISNTSVNDAAVARLQKAIPNCKVTR